MRITMFAAVLLLGLAPIAQAKPMLEPNLALPRYECMDIKVDRDHFSCQWLPNKNAFDIEWDVNDVSALPDEERHHAWHTFSKLALDIVQYGNEYLLGFPKQPQAERCYLDTRRRYITTFCQMEHH